MSPKSEESVQGTHEGLDTRWSSSSGECAVTSTRPQEHCQQSKENEDLDVVPSRDRAKQDLGHSGAGYARARAPHPPTNRFKSIATIAQGLDHARRGGLYVLEIVKLQELGNTGKNRDHRMTVASRYYQCYRGREPSRSHKRAIDQVFQEMDSRTIGQSFNGLFPSFVVQDRRASVDTVT